MSKERKDTAIFTAFEDYVGHDPARPERDLLRAMLMNALQDSRKTGDVGRKAREYLLSPDDEYIFAFRSVCDLLDIDPKRVLVIAGLRESSLKKVDPILSDSVEQENKEESHKLSS